jgi:hypothetical protein
LTARVRLALVVSLAVTLGVPAAHGWAAEKPSAAAKAAKDVEGRKLYRKYCGQCHAFAPARAVGFGQDKLKTDPGPAFDTLRVPWGLSVNAIVLAIGGHETIYEKMTWQQLYDVSKWLDDKTRHNKILATLTGANFVKVTPPSSK